MSHHVRRGNNGSTSEEEGEATVQTAGAVTLTLQDTSLFIIFTSSSSSSSWPSSLFRFCSCKPSGEVQINSLQLHKNLSHIWTFLSFPAQTLQRQICHCHYLFRFAIIFYPSIHNIRKSILLHGDSKMICQAYYFSSVLQL